MIYTLSAKHFCNKYHVKVLPYVKFPDSVSSTPLSSQQSSGESHCHGYVS